MLKFRTLLIGFALALAGIGPARAMSITTDQPPVTTLADGRTGAIAFEALTPNGSHEFVDRSQSKKATIAGLLKLPEGAHGPVPAVVIVHGEAGVTQGEFMWADRINALGIASFVIDNFTGRKFTDTETDMYQLSPTADIAGALAALRLLATHPGIDPKRIAVMGFSRGGLVALDTALEPFRHGVIDGDLRFAAHVAFYPSCDVDYVSAHLDGSPILMLLGGKDDYTPAAPCIAYADELRAKGAHIAVVTYPDANHGFDRDNPIRYYQRNVSARKCRGTIDIDNNRFRMRKGEDELSGRGASLQLIECMTSGVTMGGDPEGLEKSPGEVAAFLKSAFGL
jgi:dienelactone hydrolase